MLVDALRLGNLFYAKHQVSSAKPNQAIDGCGVGGGKCGSGESILVLWLKIPSRLGPLPFIICGF